MGHPVAALTLAGLAFVVAALVYPVPGGVSGCEGPHIPHTPDLEGYAGELWLRGGSHALAVRHRLYDAACAFALLAVVSSAAGGFASRNRLVKYQIGLALLSLVVVLFAMNAVDPVYYSAGC
jgi:hypothetical protein